MVGGGQLADRVVDGVTKRRAIGGDGECQRADRQRQRRAHAKLALETQAGHEFAGRVRVVEVRRDIARTHPSQRVGRRRRLDEGGFRQLPAQRRHVEVARVHGQALAAQVTRAMDDGRVRALHQRRQGLEVGGTDADARHALFQRGDRGGDVDLATGQAREQVGPRGVNPGLQGHAEVAGDLAQVIQAQALQFAVAQLLERRVALAIGADGEYRVVA